MSDIVVGSVAVDIVPDTRNFRTQLEAKVQGIKVDVNVEGNLDKLRAQLDEATRPREATITANADVVAAEAKLAEVARDRTANVRVNDRGDGLLHAAGNMGALASSALILGPALIPIVAAVGAIGLALGAPIALAAGGATVFGFLAGFAVKDTNKQLEAISKQREKLAGLTKGTKEYKAAQDDLKVLLSGLSPAQKKYADALDHIKGTFAELIGGKVGNQLLNPISQFLNLTADVLPKLTPIIGAVSGAISTLLGDLAKATRGPDFRNFVKDLSKDIGPDIVQLGHIFANVFEGISGLLIGFNDALGGDVLRSLGKITDKFADFGRNADKSKGLQDFIGYVRDVGPQVGDTLGAIARAIGHIVTALAPLGPPALKVVEGIANALAGIPIPVLTAIAGATAGLVAVSKLTKLGGSIGGLLKGGFFGDRGSRTNPMYVVTLNGGAGPGGSTKFFGFNPATVVLAATVAAGIFSKHFADNERDRNIKQFGTNDVVQIAMVKLQRERDAEFLREFGKKKIRIDDSPAALERLSAAQKIEAGGFQIPTDQAGPLVRGGKLDPAALFIKFGLTPERARQLINSPQISASTGNVDALNASLATASRRIDLVGPKARASFGEASRVIVDTKTKLDAIKDKKLRILVDDLAAVRSLEALQAYRLKNKTLTVTLEQEIERAVGPGGGRGHPTGSANAGAIGATLQRSAPRSGSGSGASGSGSLVHIDNVSARDLDDILRQSDKASRARSGGGVILTGAPR